MIAAVVLAAGESSRMGRDKALLPFRSSTFLEEIVSTLEKVPVQKIVVVLGHNAEEIRSSVNLESAEVVVNSVIGRGRPDHFWRGWRQWNRTSLRGFCSVWSITR